MTTQPEASFSVLQSEVKKIASSAAGLRLETRCLLRLQARLKMALFITEKLLDHLVT